MQTAAEMLEKNADHMQGEDAIQALQECLSRGLTGCLSNRNAAAYRVYVMQGDILAAHGPDDGIWIVRRLVNNGAITEGQGRQVIFYLGQGYRLEELLLDQVPDQLFLDLLVERFRQNLLDFSFLRGPMEFEDMEAIFVDNIQVGHSSLALLEDIARLRDRVAPIRRRLDILYLQPGPAPAADLRQARLQELCAPGASIGPTNGSEGRAGDAAAVRLDELVVLSPYEEGPTLDLVRQMLEDGALVEAGEEGAPPGEPAPPPRSRGRKAPEHDAAGLDASDVAPEGDRDIQGAASSSAALDSTALDAAIRQARQDRKRRMIAREHAQSDEEGILTRPVPAAEEPAPPRDLPSEEVLFDEEAALFGDYEHQGQGGSPETDAPSAGGPPGDAPRRGLGPAGFAGHPEEEEHGQNMAMFTDYDTYRGGGGGLFTVEKALLDRVDLSQPLVESLPPEERRGGELIEMGDAEDMDERERATAFSLSFGPPPLELVEQKRKVMVCNEVLAELARAIDVRHGPGSGRASVQLLLDGTPHEYAVLFMGVETDPGGQIDPNQVIRNLQRRPESERRRLLNHGVLNLIERALSSGMEELDEEAMDQMLRRVAGYQMRLGL